MSKMTKMKIASVIDEDTNYAEEQYVFPTSMSDEQIEYFLQLRIKVISNRYDNYTTSISSVNVYDKERAIEELRQEIKDICEDLYESDEIKTLQEKRNKQRELLEKYGHRYN